MRYEISATIPCFGTDAVGCFDPVKVAVRLRDTVPGLVLDSRDHAWERYEAFRSHNLDAALQTVANDATRYGPIYKFIINVDGSTQSFSGQCNRYEVRVSSFDPFPEPLKSTLLEVFNSLALDGISVQSVKQDGNTKEHA